MPTSMALSVFGTIRCARPVGAAAGVRDFGGRVLAVPGDHKRTQRHSSAHTVHDLWPTLDSRDVTGSDDSPRLVDIWPPGRPVSPTLCAGATSKVIGSAVGTESPAPSAPIVYIVEAEVPSASLVSRRLGQDASSVSNPGRGPPTGERIVRSNGEH